MRISFDGVGHDLIEFRGATRDELAGQVEYTDRGPVWVNPGRVSCVYDHTILIDGHKIRVMETTDEIMNAITQGLYARVQRKLEAKRNESGSKDVI